MSIILALEKKTNAELQSQSQSGNDTERWIRNKLEETLDKQKNVSLQLL